MLAPRPVDLAVAVTLWTIDPRIRTGHRHRDRGVIQQIPQRRVPEPLGADDPGFGPVADPGRHGHQEGVDAAGRPLR